MSEVGDKPDASPEGVNEETPSPAEIFAAAMGNVAKKAGLDQDEDSATSTVVWAAMGGWRGILEAVLPGLVFIVTWMLTLDADSGRGNLPWSLGLSVGLAVLFTLARLVQKGPAGAAFGGLIATAAAAGLSLWTGRGEDNFLLGFITNTVYGSVLLISALIGWSLLGLAIGFLKGESTAWREDKRKRRAFFWVTVAWAALFFARLAVQLPLYFAGEVAALGVAKLAMGLPLFAPLVAVTWLVVRALYPQELKQEDTASA